MRDTKPANSGAGLPRISCWRSVSPSELVEQQRHPVGRAHGGEVGIEAGLGRLVAQ